MEDFSALKQFPMRKTTSATSSTFGCSYSKVPGTAAPREHPLLIILISIPILYIYIYVCVYMLVFILVAVTYMFPGGSTRILR